MMPPKLERLEFGRHPRSPTDPLCKQVEPLSFQTLAVSLLPFLSNSLGAHPRNRLESLCQGSSEYSPIQRPPLFVVQEVENFG